METATQDLHRLTSLTWAWYAPSREDPDLLWEPPVDDPRIVQELAVNDIARLPWFFKRYEEPLSRVPLPRGLPSTEPSAVAVLAGTAEVDARDVDLSQLSRLLHLSAGVVRTMERPYGTWLFRAAGSAGGRFPLELYVAVPDGSVLPAGVHWYDPHEHALVRVGPAPRGQAPTVVVTGIPWRTGWRYRERGFRHVYWDAGTMLAQLLALADPAGIGAQLYTRFPDAAVGALVGADGVQEWPVAFPLVTAAQRAGDLGALGAPWERGEPVDVPLLDAPAIEDVILARGSMRRMDPARGLSADLLRTAMGAAMRGIALPHRVAVHDVDGVPPGVYRWPDLSAPARAGDLRDELYRVAVEQALARDAAFVVIGATRIGSLDDRAYREAHLAAGLVEGRLHLLAYALGASASGMTFLDGEVPGLLDEALDGVLFTCVGVPEYASAVGGPPGSPTAVRKVIER